MNKRRILLVMPLIALLTACQSKKEICAQWGAFMLTNVEAANRLGVDFSDLEFPESGDGFLRVNNYCEYYKN